MVKDFLGQPLAIGDSVVYLYRTMTSAFYVRATIVEFVEQTVFESVQHQVKLQSDERDGRGFVVVWPDKVIRYEAKDLRSSPTAQEECHIGNIQHQEPLCENTDKVVAL